MCIQKWKTAYYKYFVDIWLFQINAKVNAILKIITFRHTEKWKIWALNPTNKNGKRLMTDIRLCPRSWPLLLLLLDKIDDEKYTWHTTFFSSTLVWVRFSYRSLDRTIK